MKNVFFFLFYFILNELIRLETLERCVNVSLRLVQRPVRFFWGWGDGGRNRHLIVPCLQWRTEGGGVGGFKPPPSKFRRPNKIVPNSTRLWRLLKIAEFRTPRPQDVRKKVSKNVKIIEVRNCFTLAMTNKLVVIINSLQSTKK